jgi:hypothetical protein
MPFLLTTGSTLSCPHQGTVVLVASQTLLQIDGQPVLVEGDLDNAVIAGCLTVPSPGGTSKCLLVTSLLAGTSVKVSVDGKAALLDNAAGITNGLVAGVPQPWSVSSAGQTKFQGI